MKLFDLSSTSILFCTIRVAIYTKVSFSSCSFCVLLVQIDPDQVIAEKDLSLQMRIHWQCGGLLDPGNSWLKELYQPFYLSHKDMAKNCVFGLSFHVKMVSPCST